MTTGTVVDVVMPQMGVSVSEGTISRWTKQVGDTIEKDETILEISTDKVDTEVPAPAAGTLANIIAQEGETLDVGAKLAEIDTAGGSGGTAPAAPATPEPAPEPAAEPSPAPAPTPAAATPAPAATSAAGSPNGTPPAGGGAPFVSPVVARIAAEHGVDVTQVAGTGSGGRVTKKDIMSFIESGGSTGTSTAPSQSAAPAPTPAATPAPTPSAPVALPATEAAGAPAAAFTGGERIENFSPMRKAIARHMVESKQVSAHVTSTMEVDMTRVVQMRTRLKGEVEAQWGTKLTFTHFVIRALTDAIAHWPLINSEIQGDSSVIKSYVNLGVAVALGQGEGLIVPVVRNVEEKNLIGIARATNDIVDRARNKKLSPDDVAGGTFTLTNPGIFGAIHGTPIINQPQVAILDTEAIVKRPVVVTDENGNDSIAIRSMMNLCISYDHRVIDGAYAVQFLAHLKNNLQTWDEQTFVG